MGHYDRWNWRDVEFSSLVGKTLVSIEGFKEGSDEVVFTTSDGERLFMYHQHDCCESVSLVDADGDVKDLLNKPVSLAECVVMENAERMMRDAESATWTFYKLSAGYSTLVFRWVGESNGYYSEDVSFKRERSSVEID